MAASTYLAQVQQLYIAYFGRPADPIGQAYWAGIIDAAGGNIAAVQAGFSASAESQALYGNRSTIDKVTAIYNNVFNRAPDPAGLAFWVAQIDSGKVTQAQASWTIQQNAGAGDAATVQNKLTAAQAFTAQIDTAAEISGYQGTAAADSGRAFLNTVTSVNATATAAVAAAPAAVLTATSGGGVVTSFVLTTGIDNLTGTGGNDVFIGSTATVSAADQINGGAGNDTFRLFIDSAATGVATIGLPQLTNVENVYVNGGTAAAGTGLSVAALAGVTSIELDKQTTAAGTFTVTTTAAQSVVVDNFAGTVAANTIALAGANKLTVNAVTATIDVAAVATTALTVTATGANSTIGLTNSATGAPLTSLTVAGDKAITITEALTGLTTVNASTNTGGVTLNSGATNALTFTGGTGNDKVNFVAGTFGATDILDGGAGTDTLVLNDATLNAAAYTALNAVKNFEVLSFGTTVTGVDVAQVTALTQFGLNTATAGTALSGSFINSLASTKYSVDNTVDNTGTLTIANKVGETSTSVTLANTTTASHTFGGLVTTGIATVNLASTGTGTNVITALTISDNSAVVITGSAALTIGGITTTAATGSKIDGSAATGVLSLTGNTTGTFAGTAANAVTKADTLIGGSAADTLITGANGGTLTGGAGNDNFNVTAAHTTAGGLVANEYALVNITDFTKGDKITFSAATALTKVDVSAATTLAAALTTLGSSTTAGAVSWATFGGNTYVVANDGVAGVSSNDTVVKLTGALDLSTSTVTGNAVTFA